MSKILSAERNFVATIKDNLQKGLIQAFEKAQQTGDLPELQLPQPNLEVPREKEHGDFATNIAMVLTKQAKRAPRQIAEVLLRHFDLAAAGVERVEVAGTGFINFYLDKSWLAKVIPSILKLDDTYGQSNIGQGQKVQVEFVSANPTGLLHMGNARGAALGDTLSTLFTACGYDVTREFYINDAGNQIENFGLSLEARYFQLLGQEVDFPENGYQGQDIIDTVRGIIEGDGQKYLDMPAPERRSALVQIALKEKLDAIAAVLSRFGVKYDVWFSEKTLHDSGAVTQVVEDLKDKGFIYEKEGALWFKSTEFGDDKDEVIVRSNGIPTYFAADIAYHKNKFDRGFNRVINIWGADHHGHVARMKGSMTALGFDPNQLDIIIMQLVRLYKDGEIVRMSKRTGKLITLDDLIEEVGRDAARFFFVMRSADSHLDFDLDLAKSQTSENPVFYVQYAHARICSILRLITEEGEQIPQSEDANFTLLTEEAEQQLIRKLADFPEEIRQAAQALEPHRMARYAQELASIFHGFYNSCRVRVEDKELMKARLLLVNATRITLRNLLSLIGVTAPERM